MHLLQTTGPSPSPGTAAKPRPVQAYGDLVLAGGIGVPVRSGPIEGSFVAQIAGSWRELLAVAHGDTVYVQLDGAVWMVRRIDPTVSRAGAAGPGAGDCTAPMPGSVISVLVEAGQVVARNEPLLVIESMKLQMTISAPQDGVVTELPLAVGDTFQRGAVLLRLRADGEGADA